MSNDGTLLNHTLLTGIDNVFRTIEIDTLPKCDISIIEQRLFFSRVWV